MKRSMLFCIATLVFLGTGIIFAQEQVTDQECERMVKERDFEAIKRLIKNPELYFHPEESDQYSQSTRTPPILFLAIKAKDYELIQFMFEQGMSQEYRENDYENSTYLKAPIQEGDFKTVEFLLSFCAITSDDAILAIDLGRNEIVDLFIKKGFDFRAMFTWCSNLDMTCFSMSFFVRAVYKEKYDIAKKLLPLTQDVNSNYISRSAYTDDNYIFKQTTLDLVRKSKNQSIVPWLLENGAMSYDEKVAKSGYKELSASKEFEYESFSTTNSLRIRLQPNLQGKVLGSLALNERVGVLRTSEKNDSIDGLTEYWYHICTKSGLKGWVFGGYLKRVE